MDIINYKKIEIKLFVLFLFAQNLALIKTKNFGIAALTVYLIFLFMKYKMYESFKIKNMIFSILFGILVIISLIFGSNINLLRILRWLMLGFILITSLKYMKVIYSENKEYEFWNIFFNISIIILIYGLYEYIANILRLPLFLNIFSNNPSYAEIGMYNYVGGWTDFHRIYTMFFEPSAYAVFLVGVLVLLFNNKYIYKRKKTLIIILILINEMLTFSRSGWGILIYTFGGYFLLISLYKFKIYKYFSNFINKIILFIPFYNLFFMYIANKYIFNDLSSKARTNSAIYYLIKSLKSIKSILFGYGIGAIDNTYSNELWVMNYIEQQAHNGYIEFIYEFGWVLFFIVLIYFYLSTKKIRRYKDRVIVLLFTSSIFSFGSMYSVESVLVLVVMVYSYKKLENLKFMKKNYTDL